MDQGHPMNMISCHLLVSETHIIFSFPLLSGCLLTLHYMPMNKYILYCGCEDQWTLVSWFVLCKKVVITAFTPANQWEVSAGCLEVHTQKIRQHWRLSSYKFCLKTVWCTELMCVAEPMRACILFQWNIGRKLKRGVCIEGTPLT